MYNCRMEKKRLVIDLDEAAHSTLMEEARQHNLTTANYVRQALQLPLERQGVRPDPVRLVRRGIDDSLSFIWFAKQRRSKPGLQVRPA